jgi:WD40 repeat protein
VRSLCCSHTGAVELVATGDEQQKLRLFRRADCAVGAVALSYAYEGHAGVLSAVRFSHDDRYVLSVGGEDLCTFVWRVRSGSAGLGEEEEEAEEEGSDDDDDDSDVETGGGGFKWKEKACLPGGGGGDDDDDDDDDDVFVEEAAATGEELGALKPWRAAIFAPTNPPPDEPSPPGDELALRWVYGFRGFDTRCGALWASPSTLVYPAAAVVVVHDVARDTQRHFRAHEDDVLCVATAWCPARARHVVASGQKAFRRKGVVHKPTIFVWDAAEPEQKLAGPLVFTGCNQRSITLLAFDASGDVLCSVGNDDDHLVVLWDWANGRALAHVQTHKEPVYALCSLQCAPGSAAFVAVGKGFGRIFRVEHHASSGGAAAGRASDVSSVPLKLAGREKVAAQLAVCADASSVTVGSDKGNLHQYKHGTGVEDGKVTTARRQGAHDGPINALVVGPVEGGGATLLSCGKDGAVRMWRVLTLEPLVSLPVADALSAGLGAFERSSGRDHAAAPPRLCALSWHAEAGLVLGSRASELVHIPLQGAARFVTRGHAARPPGGCPASVEAIAGESGAARALAVAPRGALVATGGDDACVRLWGLQARRQLPLGPLHAAAAVTALGFDQETESDGASLRLAVGTASGGWQVHRLSLAQDARQTALHPTAEHAYAPSPEGASGGGPARRITELRFSPDRQWLAVGCADAVIYLYDSDRGYAPSQRCCGHSSAITRLRRRDVESGSSLLHCPRERRRFHRPAWLLRRHRARLQTRGRSPGRPGPREGSAPLDL